MVSTQKLMGDFHSAGNFISGRNAIHAEPTPTEMGNFPSADNFISDDNAIRLTDLSNNSAEARLLRSSRYSMDVAGDMHADSSGLTCGSDDEEEQDKRRIRRSMQALASNVLGEIDKQIASTKAYISEQKGLLDDIRKKIGIVERDIGELETTRRQQEKELEEERETLKEAEKELEAVETELAEVEKRQESIAQMQGENRGPEWDKYISELEAENQAKLQELQASQTELVAQVKGATMNISLLEEGIAQTDAAIIEARSKLETLRAEETATELEIKRAEAELRDLEQTKTALEDGDLRRAVENGEITIGEAIDRLPESVQPAAEQAIIAQAEDPSWLAKHFPDPQHPVRQAANTAYELYEDTKTVITDAYDSVVDGASSLWNSTWNYFQTSAETTAVADLDAATVTSKNQFAAAAPGEQTPVIASNGVTDPQVTTSQPTFT